VRPIHRRVSARVPAAAAAAVRISSALRAAAHVDRLEARLLGHPRHDRIERYRRDDELIAADELTEFLQRTLLYILKFVPTYLTVIPGSRASPV